MIPQEAQAPMPPAPPPGPQGSPMAQPTPNDGERQMGMVQAETAMQMLEQAIPLLRSNTPEGSAAVDALKLLSKALGARQQSQQLVPAQIAEMARAQQQTPIAQLMAGGQGGAPAPQPVAA